MKKRLLDDFKVHKCLTKKLKSFAWIEEMFLKKIFDLNSLMCT